MERWHKSKIWIKESLENLVNDSDCIGEVIKKLGLNPVPGQYRQFHKYIRLYGIDTSHFTHNPHPRTGKYVEVPFDKLTDIAAIKKRIIRDKLIEYKCAGCGINKWITSSLISDNDQLTLQIDHIDGNPLNNLLNNLRFLCPNCHTKTKTFSTRKHKKPTKVCLGCGKPVDRKNNHCSKCRPFTPRKTKIEWPSDNELLIRLENTPFTTLAKELGVSDNAIRRRLRRKK